MVHIDIVCVGKIKDSYLRDAISEYSKRLSRFCKLNIIELNDEKIPDSCSATVAETIKKKEGDNIISHLKKDSYILAVDLKGKELDSIAFSQKINTIYSNINSNITFIIGGSLGLSPEVLSACNELISFSKMTFPHQLIRVFLLEQVYRAFKIINNESYHK